MIMSDAIVTFSQQSESWLESLKTRKRKPVSPATLRVFGSYMRRLTPMIGEKNLADISNGVLRDLVQRLDAQKLSAKMISCSQERGAQSISTHRRSSSSASLPSPPSTSSRLSRTHGRIRSVPCIAYLREQAFGSQNAWPFASMARTSRPAGIQLKRQYQFRLRSTAARNYGRKQHSRASTVPFSLNLATYPA